MDICIDFDGTCTTHEFPKIGEDIGAIPVLKELVANGHNLILFTMRSDQKIEMPDGSNQYTLYLAEAIEWFKRNEIPLYGIQANPTQKDWTSSPKAYGQIYIDDAALGCPLIHEPYSGRRPYVNWVAVRSQLIDKGIIQINENHDN